MAEAYEAQLQRMDILAQREEPPTKGGFTYSRTRHGHSPLFCSMVRLLGN
jgi:hypothetical protein